MVDNTYPYVGPGTRWVIGDATEKGKLDNPLINTDHLFEALNHVADTDYYTNPWNLPASSTVGGEPIVTGTDLASIQTALDAIDANVDTLLTRLTAGRAANLDNIAQVVASSADLATLLSRLTAARAGYLDNVNYDLAGNINTLLARLTSARAGYLDNLNGFAGGQYTSARAGYLDNIATAPLSSVVQSIQSGVIYMNGSTSGSTTISAVDTTKAVVLYMGDNSGSASSNSSNWKANVYLASATSVGANRGGTDGNYFCRFTVLEFV